MSRELAEAIVEASVRLQKKEDDTLNLVGAYLTAVDGYFQLRGVDHQFGNPGFDQGYGPNLFDNYFTAVDVARFNGYELMQGAAAKKIVKEVNTIHKENGMHPVLAVFHRRTYRNVGYEYQS